MDAKHRALHIAARTLAASIVALPGLLLAYGAVEWSDSIAEAALGGALALGFVALAVGIALGRRWAHLVAVGFFAPIAAMIAVAAIDSVVRTGDATALFFAIPSVATVAVLVLSYATLKADIGDPTRHWPIAAALVASGVALLGLLGSCDGLGSIPACTIAFVSEGALLLTTVALFARRRAAAVLTFGALAALHWPLAMLHGTLVYRWNWNWNPGAAARAWAYTPVRVSSALGWSEILVGVSLFLACLALAPMVVRWFRTEEA